MDSLGAVIDGAVFLLRSPLVLAAAVAAALVVGRVGLRPAFGVAAALALAAEATMVFPPLPANVVAPTVLLVLGVAIASGWRAARPVRIALALAGAVAAGLAGGLQTATLDEAVGGLLLLVVLQAVLLVPAAMVRVSAAAERALGLARRMAGAWIAAIGALLLVLALR